MAKKKQTQKRRIDPASEAFQIGQSLLYETGMFTPLMHHAQIIREKSNKCPAKGWAVVTNNGLVHVHPTRRADPQEWQYVLAHCLLHLAFDHFRPKPTQYDTIWNTACDCFIANFLAELKIGRAPFDITAQPHLPAQSEEAMFRYFLDNGVADDLKHCGTTDAKGNDMLRETPMGYYRGQPPDWAKLFGQGVTLAVNQAVADISDVSLDRNGMPHYDSEAERARQWFITHYPLLGALAANFKVIENPQLSVRMGISVAAVNTELKEIYFNPGAGLTQEQYRFVMAHEILHVGLRHDVRCQGRDPFLWNVACDYVINHWLVEMGVGDMPAVGALYDESLKGLSAETIYDHIVRNIRTYRKLATLRGNGLGDILTDRKSGWWSHGEGLSLDEFYRRCLAQGLVYHQEVGRGFLPAGLIEEIHALSQPPIPWDVELARWFDEQFPPLEKHRTYARPSRRQASTPDIPRPRWINMPEDEASRTYGVILDTSGSMERNLLAKALGTIASYSIARDVPLVRVVFCDATHYDQGYMAPETIANRVQIRGRGGTVLQPAIDLLEHAEDFPKDGPLLIITDGYCDNLQIRASRKHAYLLPKGNHLPFTPKGEMFYVE